jgi:3-methylcrotonyl-CoA carboxylase alpha subunit
MMFRKLLIANRGEIACRVMRTCRRLGIATVAVYSAADEHSRHVAMADEAYPIGPSPARESYLRIDRIIEAARLSGAEAIHPGYGFLSENAGFADACAESGIVFIGPPADAIRAMGSKAEAKALMQRAGVPLVPGYHGAAQDLATLIAAATDIGYPVLVKASAGGGGKGMRVVEQPEALESALAGAAREAAASFGDNRLLIEKYLTRPRHIEIQVFADTQGNCVHLFERDCSIQRRHQKVIEEAPAPWMTEQRRAQMGAAAIAACRAVGYVGAGTVEFIAEGDDFYFMEMNTRLQVEHPVTEMVTGQELVEWQLLVACGEALPATQEALKLRGHAIEARIYAEDPALDFRPSIGRIAHLRAPRRGRHVRIDTGVREGDAITPFYDPMIAKLIVWDEDRPAALQRLRTALAQYEIGGLATNLNLLRAIVAEPDFADAMLDTGFIARHPHLLAPTAKARDEAVLGAALWTAWHDAAAPSDSHSPWAASDAWQLNLPCEAEVLLREGETLHHLRVTAGAHGALHADLGAGVRAITAERARGDTLRLRLDGVAQRVTIARGEGRIIVIQHGGAHSFLPVDPLAPPDATVGGAGGNLVAPLPARVVRILTRAGDLVAEGAALVVIEAMKMEMTLTAPGGGLVAGVHVSVDAMVAEGALLVSFEIPAD